MGVSLVVPDGPAVSARFAMAASRVPDRRRPELSRRHEGDSHDDTTGTARLNPRTA